jgi:hypothetical protein
MEIVVVVVCLAIGIGIGRWTTKGRALDEEAQSLNDARMALRANPAKTEPSDPRSGRPPDHWSSQ